MKKQLRTIWLLCLALLTLGGAATPDAHAQKTVGERRKSCLTLSEAEVVTIPIQYEGGLVFVNGTVNGKPARFVLDTGANREIGTGFAHKVGADGVLSIAAVVPESPASDAKLRIGDVILQINDVPITSQNAMEEPQRVGRVAGTTVTFLVRQKSDGKTRKVVLTLRDLL